QWTRSTSTQSVRSRLRLASTSRRMLGRLGSPRGPELPGGRHLPPTLGDEDDVTAAAFERPPHDLLGVPAAVRRRGVHAVDAALEGAMDGLDSLVVLDRAVAVARHRPAPEAHHGDVETSTSERTIAHLDPPWV